MCIAVTITAHGFLDDGRSEYVKFAVSSYQEVNIFFLCDQIVQELVKAVFYLCWSSIYLCPKKQTV